MLLKVHWIARSVWTTRFSHSPYWPRSTAVKQSLRTLSTTSANMLADRDYNAAIAALNTLQSNFSILDSIRKSGRSMNAQSMPEMREWCRRIGYEPADLNRLNLIHIAGTKGKGSTSAFISSILCQYAATSQSPYPCKIGLFTSPHLRSVRERIQINNEPLSEALFAHYFFEVWDRLEASAKELGPPDFDQRDPSIAAEDIKPVYFRYLTLMAFHAYITEGVDTAIIECGIGGEYDSTNVLVAPMSAGVTSLGIDHTAVLGETIQDIAWHKAGIFKRDMPTKQVFTVASQPADALPVLRARAEDENGLTLHVIPRHAAVDAGDVALGLAADFQKINASLAISIASAHLRAYGVPAADLPDPLDPHAKLPAPFQRGLLNAVCGGRCEVKRQGNILWHLDGGHTVESIKLAAAWFAGSASASTARRQRRILLFNQQTRDANALATTMYTALRDALAPTASAGDGGSAAPLFDTALFSTNITFASASARPAAAPAKPDASASKDDDNKTGRYKPDLVSMNNSAADVTKLTVQTGLAQTWTGLDEGCAVEVCGTIEEAVRRVRDEASLSSSDETEVVVLVTGSLHLVGGVLEVLDT